MRKGTPRGASFMRSFRRPSPAPLRPTDSVTADEDSLTACAKRNEAKRSEAKLSGGPKDVLLMGGPRRGPGRGAAAGAGR
eukprot:3917781-Alexandrium_andersonii.AAC.1